MGNNEQFMEIIKHFGDVIKDLNGTFGSLSQSIVNLAATVEKLPRMHDIEARLELMEKTLLLKGEHRLDELVCSDELKELESKTLAILKEVLGKVHGLNELLEDFSSGKIDKENLYIELEKKKLELEQTSIIESNKTKRESGSNKIQILKIVIPWTVTVGAGIFAIIKYIIPFFTN